jgi:hypothetical protein
MSSTKPGRGIAVIRRVSYSDQGKVTVHAPKKVAIVHTAEERVQNKRRKSA